jgi:hypothetical protein
MDVNTVEQSPPTEGNRELTNGARARARRRALRRRRALAVSLVLAVATGVFAWRGVDKSEPVDPQEVRGSLSWALTHYGQPEGVDFKERYIVEIDFLGRSVLVHRGAKRHFLRLERLFEARAPEYASGVAYGELDDWSYLNRDVRGGRSKSNHAFGIAIDINALANVVGTPGDMPVEVVAQWEREGGDWGGDWSRPDPMHFETHLTPEEIRERYRRDGTPRTWYLEELLGG